MSKMVKILLSRPLNVNLGRDENGQVQSVQLQAGFQEVEQEVAENWFVKAHCQEITTEDLQNAELQAQLEKANADLAALQTQSEAAKSADTSAADAAKTTKAK